MTEYMVYFLLEENGKFVKRKKRVLAQSEEQAKEILIREYIQVRDCKKIADEGLNYLKNMFGFK